MGMWEIRERSSRHGRTSHDYDDYDKDEYSDDYECGYRDGYRKAMRESRRRYDE